MAQHTLLLFGEMCPGPLLRVEQKLKEMQPGDLLIAESDHSCTARIMKEHLRRLPCRFQVSEVADGIWQFRIERR